MSSHRHIFLQILEISWNLQKIWKKFLSISRGTYFNFKMHTLPSAILCARMYSIDSHTCAKEGGSLKAMSHISACK